jgi:hypothetical protein
VVCARPCVEANFGIDFSGLIKKPRVLLPLPCEPGKTRFGAHFAAMESQQSRLQLLPNPSKSLLQAAADVCFHQRVHGNYR